MKAILLLSSVVLLFSSYTGSNSTAPFAQVEKDSVYICTGQFSTAYHYTNSCQGIARCTHEIRKVTLNNAKAKYDRTLCGWEK